MNIFAVSDDVIVCAQALDDKRLVKMLTETCQLLSAARIINGLASPYKINHAKHPATLWAAQRFQHRCWLGTLICAYYTEYRCRFGNKNHGAWDKFEALALAYSNKFDATQEIAFVNCARHLGVGVDFKSEPNTHIAYRKYLVARWKIAIAQKSKRTIPTFTNRKPPAFAKSVKGFKLK